MRKSLTQRLGPAVAVSALVVLAGCSSLTPSPLEDQAVRDRAAADRVKMYDHQEPIAAPITLDEAIARAQSFSTSSDMDRKLRSVEFSWNVRDFGVSYYRAKQRADEYLIAQEPGVSSKAETELELVRASARAAVSKYQRAIAYANAAAAYARIQHSPGQDFELGESDKLSVAELARQVNSALAKAEKRLPTPLFAQSNARDLP